MPWVRRCCVRMEWCLRHVSFWFCPLARDASRYVSVDVCSDLRPEVVASDDLAGALLSRVSCRDGVMMRLDDVLPELLVLGNIQSLFAEEKSVFFTPSWVLVR